MPKLNGTACLQKMRERRRDLPAILMSGLHDTSRHTEGATEAIFMRKPFPMAELRRVTEESLRKA